MITLVILQGPDKGARFELPDAPALIGRDSRALPLADNTVSRRHAELKPNDRGDWTLRDLGSSNGTYVNGQRADRPVQLKLGDQFRVGRTLIVFGAQPGVMRSTSANVELAGQESGMDSSIINTLPSSDDSLVLAVPDPAGAAVSNLKILYRLSAALGSSFDLHQILDVIMDLVFEHVQADRGIILLVDPHDPTIITPQVVKIREEPLPRPKPSKPGEPAPPLPPPKTVEEPEKIHASRTIIDHVVKSGDGVLSSNAMADPRFKKGRSVHDMGIRSCLCAPIKLRRLDARSDLKSPDEIAGVIYIDSSVKNYTYSTDQLRLLTSIGLQAGMAIQNARLYQAGLEAERLAAVGETTAALSHSIKNILQALRGGADVVEIGLKNSNVDQARKGWGVVERNLDKIYNLTLNLLAYSKPREPAVQMVNPRKLIHECIELLANVANERGVMAVADVEKDVPAVPMDPDGMHQVIMNLLSNALDAMKPGVPGGLIRVNCRYDAREKLTIIEVIDNGVGIEPSMQKHLFQLFHSTKGNRGTGLGLAVARKIVEEHDGSISAISKPGEGTTFTIRLPVYTIAGDDASSTHGPGVHR